MFVTSSQKFCAHLDEPFVVFPIDGDVIFQVFKHVLGHGFGRVIDDHPTRAQPHDTGKVEGEETSSGIFE